MSDFIKRKYGTSDPKEAIDYEMLKIELLEWLNNSFENSDSNIRRRSLNRLLEDLIDAGIVSVE